MFEGAELGRQVSSEDYKAQVPALREDLLEVQRGLRDSPRSSVIIVFGGVDGAGKSETVNLLNEWMDPRWIVTRAFGEPSEEEWSGPSTGAYWRGLPPRGRVGLFLSSWYSRPLVDRVHRRTSRRTFEGSSTRSSTSRTALADNGALILKFWMHLGQTIAEEAR